MCIISQMYTLGHALTQQKKSSIVRMYITNLDTSSLNKLNFTAFKTSKHTYPCFCSILLKLKNFTLKLHCN